MARPTVLVMLRPRSSFPRDTECTDVPSGPQALAFFAQDVPLAIAGHYRVQDRGWGAIGDSTGGYCAAKLAMLHSDVFTAAVTLSGYFHTLRDSTTGDLWGGSRVLWNLNDLEWRLRHLPPPPVSLLVTTAKDEAAPAGMPTAAGSWSWPTPRGHPCGWTPWSSTTAATTSAPGTPSSPGPSAGSRSAYPPPPPSAD